MAQPRGRRRLATLSIFLLAALTLLAIGGPLRRPAGGLARAVISPFADVVRGVTKPIGEAFAGIFNYDDVVAQNHVLAAQVGQLRQEQTAASFQARQLQNLMALNHLPFIGSLPVVTAQETMSNLSNFAATIEINKGQSAGVLVGMPVVGAGGLVGIVSATTSGGSTVTLVTDASQSIGVTFGNGYDAVVHGQGPTDNLAADFVAPGTAVHVGETFFTSGLQGGLFPAGIPVGTVQGSQTRRGATQLSISVKPAANLSNLAFVDVVLWEPGT